MTIDANFNGTNDTDTNLQFRFSGVRSVADPDLQRGEAGGGGRGGLRATVWSKNKGEEAGKGRPLPWINKPLPGCKYK